MTAAVLEASPALPAPATLQAVVDSLARHGDRLAVLAFRPDGHEAWTFADLDRRVRHVARGLASTGVEPGDRVAVLAPPSPAWIAVALGIVAAGAVVVPIDAQASGEALAHQVLASDACALFTTRALAARVDALDGPRRRFLLDAGPGDPESWTRLPGDGDAALPIVRPGDPAALFYTAGTTGRPKGVPLTQANCASNLGALLAQELVDARDRALLPLPFHHVYPFMVGLFAPLASGAAVVLPAGLTGQQIVRALVEGEVTAIVGVPRFHEALVDGLRGRIEARGRIAAALFRAGMAASIALRRRLGVRAGRWLFRPLLARFAPRVRLVASGGARLAPEIAWALTGLGWDVAIGYGLTETSPVLTFTEPGDLRFDTVGRPLPGVEIRIDRPDPQGEGEVLARGPNVFAGYDRLPEQTAAAFTDGWFRTGDLGRVEADGSLRLSGRKSELIVLPGGENVMPEDVERRYEEEPAIAEIGVFERDGRLVAVVVPDVGWIRRAGADVGESLRRALAARSPALPSYQRVTEHAVAREPLPRTRLGKLQRHRLPDIFERARAGEARARPVSPEEMAEEDRALLDEPAAREVWDWLVARYPDRRVAPDASPQIDLGIDSLEWLALSLEMRERAGIELSEEALASVETVRDLLRAAAAAARSGPGGASPLERPEEALTADQRRWLTPTGPAVTALGAGIYALNRALMRGVFGLRVTGLERLPADRPVVLTPNHASYLDPFALAAALPLARLRRTYWAGWSLLLFRGPLMRAFSRATHVVPVDPRRGATSLAFGAAVLGRGFDLVWFPEGRRSPTGRLQPFRAGIGMLLERYPSPIVPVLLHGTYEALPPGRRWPRRARIGVVFGRPLDPADLAARGAGDEAHERIAAALHDEVAALARAVPAG